MTTGRIDDAPDYKSRLGLMGQQTATDIRAALRADRHDTERARLRDTVVEAARVWFKLNQTQELEAAMVTLLEFESKQDHK